jgi:hypothetical protein
MQALGSILAALGFLYGIITREFSDPQWQWNYFNNLLSGSFLGLGGWIYIRGRQIEAKNNAGLLSLDPRPPIIYLRSFRIDTAIETHRRAGFLFAAGTISFEESLSRIMRPFGPLVTLGRPGEAYPEFGATRVYPETDNWREKVADMLKKSRFVFFIWDDSQSLNWEFECMTLTTKPENCVLIVPKEALNKFSVWALKQFGVAIHVSDKAASFFSFNEKWVPRLLKRKRHLFQTLAPVIAAGGFYPYKNLVNQHRNKVLQWTVIVTVALCIALLLLLTR